MFFLFPRLEHPALQIFIIIIIIIALQQRKQRYLLDTLQDNPSLLFDWHNVIKGNLTKYLIEEYMYFALMSFLGQKHKIHTMSVFEIRTLMKTNQQTKTNRQNTNWKCFTNRLCLISW